MRCRITEFAQGIEVFDCFSRFVRIVDALRLVDDENRTTLRHKFTGSLVHFIAFLIEKIFVLFDRVDIDDHDFKVGGKREITHFVALFGVVNEEVCAFAVILLTEVFFRYLQGLICTLTDCHARHKNDKFIKAVTLVEFVDGLCVDKRLACTRFHLDVGAELFRLGKRQQITLLHLMKVAGNFLRRKRESIAITEYGILRIVDNIQFSHGKW